ncbi:hypothetical protein UFOVP607_21 [uncultured Caudovirales phage]|uniref:DUF6948 domain-containing protein n=1 Tax=uncultured Caudovirales phage TaxID=2100421 RepID=A0A6J5MZ84_9CAUD|nr:hypothetical protein UFOVP607_21 [uncultured Caudovirales phage]
MNIEDLTIGEAKQLVALFGGLLLAPKTDHPMVGKFVIARCYGAGVHAGEVVSVDGEEVILKDSLRLWAWKADDGIALSGVAQCGLKAESKVDKLNPEIYLTGVCELIPCAPVAKESIHGLKN